MTSLKILPDEVSFAKAQALLRRVPDGMVTAGVRAANRTVRTGKARAGTIIAAQVGVTKGAMSNVLYVKKASRSKQFALLLAKARGINLIRFGARQTASGVSSRIKSIAHAFIRPDLEAHPRVFLRIGKWRIMKKGRYAGKRREVIAGVQGYSKEQLMRLIPPAMSQTREVMKAAMIKNLNHEVEYLLTKSGASS